MSICLLLRFRVSGGTASVNGISNTRSLFQLLTSGQQGTDYRHTDGRTGRLLTASFAVAVSYKLTSSLAGEKGGPDPVSGENGWSALDFLVAARSLFKRNSASNGKWSDANNDKRVRTTRNSTSSSASS